VEDRVGTDFIPLFSLFSIIPPKFNNRLKLQSASLLKYKQTKPGELPKKWRCLGN